LIARMPADSSGHWRSLLAGGIPAPGAIGLLQVLLWEGQAARAQWSRWAKAVGDPRIYFEREFHGRKGLLALLAHRISVNEIDVGADFAT
jgi:hypothetical protein